MSASERLGMRFLPIPAEIAREARTQRRDRFGHELSITTTQAPCRLCLRISNAPEDLILLSYQPSKDTGPYAEIGPIFVHAGDCDPYSRTEEFPRDFLDRRLILRAYGYDGRIVDAGVAEPGSAQECAARFLSDRNVEEVHVRHVSYTCYDFKIIRGPKRG
jgi:hypothetical protein